MRVGFKLPVYGDLIDDGYGEYYCPLQGHSSEEGYVVGYVRASDVTYAVVKLDRELLSVDIADLEVL